MLVIHQHEYINVSKHIYFNRVIRVWNSLPPIDIHLPYTSIKRSILNIYWSFFETQISSG